MKCSRWNEIDLEMFLEILSEYYWGDKFKDKILEISNLSEYSYIGNPGSLFIGNQIDIRDYKKYNESTLKALDTIGLERVLEKAQVSYCMVSTINPPLVMPLYGSEHYDYLVWSWFNGKMSDEEKQRLMERVGREKLISQQIQLWHLKNPGESKRYVSIDENSRESFERMFPELKKMVLVRVVDKEYWQSLVSAYLKGNLTNELLGKDYPKRESIERIP